MTIRPALAALLLILPACHVETVPRGSLHVVEVRNLTDHSLSIDGSTPQERRHIRDIPPGQSASCQLDFFPEGVPVTMHLRTSDSRLTTSVHLGPGQPHLGIAEQRQSTIEITVEDGSLTPHRVP